MIFNQCCLNLRLIPGFDDQLALLAGHPSVGPLQVPPDQGGLRGIGALRALHLAVPGGSRGRFGTGHFRGDRWGLLHPGILGRLVAFVFSLQVLVEVVPLV